MSELTAAQCGVRRTEAEVEMSKNMKDVRKFGGITIDVDPYRAISEGDIRLVGFLCCVLRTPLLPSNVTAIYCHLMLVQCLCAVMDSCS